MVPPKQKDVLKEEPADNSPSKPSQSQPARGTPSNSKISKGKRKINEESPKTSVVPPKKVKTENVCHYFHELAFTEPFAFYFFRRACLFSNS